MLLSRTLYSQMLLSRTQDSKTPLPRTHDSEPLLSRTPDSHSLLSCTPDSHMRLSYVKTGRTDAVDSYTGLSDAAVTNTVSDAAVANSQPPCHAHTLLLVHSGQATPGNAKRHAPGRTPFVLLGALLAPARQFGVGFHSNRPSTYFLSRVPFLRSGGHSSGAQSLCIAGQTPPSLCVA